MSRTQTIVQLSDDLVAALDAEAARRGTSRSAVIREAIVAHLAMEAAIDQALVDGYRRIPPGRPDGWDDLDSFADASTRETLQRLDDEERQAGHAPW